MAPEIEESSMYSPIKADRWSTGQVLRYLLNLNKFGEEDTVLRMTARKLTARDPEQRSSMLQVRPIGLGRGERGCREEDLARHSGSHGENVKPQMVKKQKLSGHDNRRALGDIRQRPVVPL
jgi:hypothetical protein